MNPAPASSYVRASKWLGIGMSIELKVRVSSRSASTKGCFADDRHVLIPANPGTEDDIRGRERGPVVPDRARADGPDRLHAAVRLQLPAAILDGGDVLGQ